MLIRCSYRMYVGTISDTSTSPSTTRGDEDDEEEKDDDDDDDSHSAVAYGTSADDCLNRFALITSQYFHFLNKYVFS